MIRKILQTRPIIVAMGVFFLFRAPILAQTVTVPHLINFQSVVNGVGGVPLSDGIHPVRFRLLNAAEETLYEETQSVESIAGVVSAMIGSSAEIPFAVLAPGQARFLGVTAEGAGPETVMEIVSNPYALYAEQALQVAPKSIGTESIIPKSITADLLADNVLQNLLPANLVQQSQLDVLKGDYRSAFGAGKIGVDTTFVYSKGPTVQNVLKDFDVAIYQRQINLEKQSSDLTGRINTSTKALQDKDDNLQSQTNTINTTIGQLQADDASFQAQISTKLATAGGTMSGILNMGLNRITTVADPVSPTDATTRNYVDQADGSLQTQINTKLAASGGTMNGILDMGLNRITTVAEPVSPTDAATRNYVDTKVNGISSSTSAEIDALKTTPKIGGWADISVGVAPGYSVTIHDSYNVTSATYNMATQELTVNWTTPFRNAFYSVALSSVNSDNINPQYENKLATSCGIKNTGSLSPPWNHLTILAVGHF